MSVGRNIPHMTEAAASRGHERSVAMTPPQERTNVGRHHTPPEHTPRLRLKPKAPHTGYVDGAWWPHSDDLTTELPDLLAVLSVRLEPIDRVLYKLTDWAKAPAELAIGGRAVNSTGTDPSRRTPSKSSDSTATGPFCWLSRPTPTRSAHMPP